MPRLKDNEVPRLREHRASGRAVVTLSGKDVYCGAWGTPEAEETYRRKVAEWLAAGRQLPEEQAGPTVRDLANAWLAWLEARNRKRGQETTHVERARRVAGEVAALYGSEPAAGFRPTWMRTLAGTWKARGLVTLTTNQYLSTVRQLVKWGVKMELIPAEALVRVQAAGGVSWRDGFEVPEKVGPVPEDVLAATLAAFSTSLRGRQVRDLLFLMRHSGMRPAEACSMRAGDIEQSLDVWIYRVASDWNKVEHKGIVRIVPLGSRCREVISPWLERAKRINDGGYYLFRNLAGGPCRVNSLRNAVYQACDRARVTRWSPGALRHNYATEVRSKFGIEAARVALGHSDAGTTLIYAERDLTLARKIAEALG
jgi:integrase